MASTSLMKNFILFAKSMPAVAVQGSRLVRGVQILANELRGEKPALPHPRLRNIPLPTYGLAYSVFVDELLFVIEPMTVSAKISVHVHVQDKLDAVISEYIISCPSSIGLEFLLDEDNNEIYFSQVSSPPPTILPSFATSSDEILRAQGLAEPVRDTYLREVELPILWLTSPTFVQLVIKSLPRLNLSELAPSLTFKSPLRSMFSEGYYIFSSPKVYISTGGCEPKSILVEPDPMFPYGEPLPQSTRSPRTRHAVYLPKTRLLSFIADKIQPAIQVRASETGGVIKWAGSGSIGLGALEIDIAQGEDVRGIISLRARIDFSAAARAWIDGPCGEINVTSAQIDGTGELSLDFSVKLDTQTLLISAELIVTSSDLTDVHFVVGNLPWPLSAVADEILGSLARQEVRKLTGRAQRVGEWPIVGEPGLFLAGGRPPTYSKPNVEGCGRIAAMFGSLEPDDNSRDIVDVKS